MTEARHPPGAFHAFVVAAGFVLSALGFALAAFALSPSFFFLPPSVPSLVLLSTTQMTASPSSVSTTKYEL